MKKVFSSLLVLTFCFSLVPCSIAAAADSSDLISAYYFSYNPMQQERSFYLPFYYSDAYFAQSSAAYNEHLATMSLNLAMAGMQKGSGDRAYRHAPARKMLADIGCDDQSIYASEYAVKMPMETSIGYVMGNKKISLKDGTYTLLPITVRGNGYGKEWTSNFLVGPSGEAEGLAIAAEQLFDGIEQYLRDYDLLEEAAREKLLFWITGYSRGGSVAALTAKGLVEKYGTEAVYAYPMEPLLCGSAAAESPDADYSCIHNLTNYADIITRMPQGMGLKLYGQIHSFPSADAGTYAKERERMLQQLSAIDASYSYDDAFSLAHIELTYSDFLHIIPSGIEALPLTDYSYSGSVNHLIGEWQDALCKALLDWSIENRETFIDPDLFTYQGQACPSMEDALCTLTGIFLGDRGLADIGIVAERLKPVLGEISDIEKLTLYNNVIKGWDSLSQRSKENYISEYWDKVEASGALSVYSAEEQSAIKRCWPTLLYTLLPFVCSDYASSAALFGYNGKNTHELFLGTMLYNGLRAFVSHDFIINLAWLRSFDSYYDDVPCSLDTLPDEQLFAPKAYVGSDNASENSNAPTPVPTAFRIRLDDMTHRGEMIFFSLQDMQSGEMLAENEIYRGGISLPNESDPSIIYKLTAQSRTGTSKSEDVSYYFTVCPALCLSAQIGLDGIYYFFSNGVSFSAAPQLIAAAYNSSGKLAKITSINLSASPQCSSGVLPMDYHPAYTYRLFLISSSSCIPLYSAWSKKTEIRE